MLSKKPLIFSVVGARPQFIKLAPLAPVLSRRFHHIIVHTGQHYDYDMSQVFFRELHLPKPKYNLDVGSGSHALMTANIMIRLEKLLGRLQPDIILVYGDTNSTLAGALTAAKLQIPVGHIEAGLRSNRLDMPEEINRRLTDQVSSLLFCPTETALDNLKKEGIKEGVVHAGDLMYELIATRVDDAKRSRAALKRFGLEAGRFLLVTVHRAANSDRIENLKTIVSLLAALNEKIVFPVHPRTVSNLKKFGLWRQLAAIKHLTVAEPLSYLDNLSLIRHARAVLTDSGGMQKEAAFVGTPCITLREETEWPETLKQGNFLAGLSQSKIVSRLCHLPQVKSGRSHRIKGREPSEIISLALRKFLGAL
ncbi:MAG: UDP-N-acetylglucosamine 2-epimerase (non-hydrolyzing) [Candidatus Zixiibacteriota bacterium]